MAMTWIQKLVHARRVAVPLVAVNTPDPMSTMQQVTKALNGNGSPVLVWDVCRGLWGFPGNEAGKTLAKSMATRWASRRCFWRRPRSSLPRP